MQLQGVREYCLISNFKTRVVSFHICDKHRALMPGIVSQITLMIVNMALLFCCFAACQKVVQSKSAAHSLAFEIRSGKRPYMQHACLPVLVTKLREPFAYVKASCLIAFSRKLQPPTRHSISSSFSRISPSFSCKQRPAYLQTLRTQAKERCKGHRQQAEVEKQRENVQGKRQRQKAEAEGRGKG